MGQLRDFWNMLSGKPTAASKALNVTLAPNGFVNEVTVQLGKGRADAPDSSTAALESLLTLNELVLACINVKATAARDPRLVVQTQETDDQGRVSYAEQTGHPFRQLIMRPNPRMTEGDLMRAAIVSWDVSNPRRVFFEKVYDRGRLIELWPLNPALMRPDYNSTRSEVTGYTWSDGRNRRSYTLDELLIRSAPAWYDPPPLVAALSSADADSLQTDYIRTFFLNGGIPPIFLKYHNITLDDTRREEIRQKWQAVYGGSQAAGQVGILDMNADIQTAGAKLDELASMTLRQVAESRICMVLGVPPLIVYAYVGLMRATYSNLKEAWSSFWDSTMSPAFKEWRDFWTWTLLTEFEDEADIRAERVRLNYDMSQVPALADDVDAIQARSRANFQARIINQNEARSAIGVPPIDGGDTTYYSTAPALAPSPPPSAPKARKARETKVTRESIERRAEKATRAYLAAEYEKAARAVEAN